MTNQSATPNASLSRGQTQTTVDTYKNPILFADYSDPDAIRVGDDYWLTASSFSHVPGLPILHSRDLVNWRLVNHALPRLVPEDHYAIHRPGCGVWAPAIRFHAGLFWIFYPDPDFGIYVITAADPAGSWSQPFLIKSGKGLIDPCPLWTSDNKAYFVHGWAKSRSGICNVLTLHEMSLDAKTLLDEGRTIFDGAKESEWHTVEGPKLYERDGWFWIFAPANGVATGFQSVFRSRNIHGPYEARKVLHQGNSDVNGPHQGAWVDTPSGEHWFMHFQERQPFGRIVHLQPMRWRDDAWPVMGLDPENTGVGDPVSTHQRPYLPPGESSSPPQSDTFTGGKFGKQWQWQANPQPSWIGPKTESDGLHLTCVSRSPQVNFWNHGPILLQKLTGPNLTATVEVALAPKATGDAAGLIVFGYDFFWIGIVSSPHGLTLEVRECPNAKDGHAENCLVSMAIENRPVTLRLISTENGQCQFSFTQNGAFTEFGPPFNARESKWVGAKFGFFATNLAPQETTGSALFKNLIVP